MKNFTKIAGIIAMIAVIGFSFAACGGGGGGGVTIDSKWLGKYESGGYIIDVAADMVTINGDEYTVSSDEGTSTVDNGERHGYALKPTEGIISETIYFYDADPDFLMLGSSNIEYKKQQ